MASSYRRSATEDLQNFAEKKRLLAGTHETMLENLNKSLLSSDRETLEILKERVAIRCELKRKLDHVQQQIDFKTLKLRAIDGDRAARASVF